MNSSMMSLRQKNDELREEIQYLKGVIYWGGRLLNDEVKQIENRNYDSVKQTESMYYELVADVKTFLLSMRSNDGIKLTEITKLKKAVGQ